MATFDLLQSVQSSQIINILLNVFKMTIVGPKNLMKTFCNKSSHSIK